MEYWTAQETTHTCTKPTMQQIVINLRGSKIIEANTKQKEVSVVYNLHAASRKQCCSSKSSYQDHLPPQT
jgi:hypothetical protein